MGNMCEHLVPESLAYQHVLARAVLLCVDYIELLTQGLLRIRDHCVQLDCLENFLDFTSMKQRPQLQAVPSTLLFPLPQVATAQGA